MSYTDPFGGGTVDPSPTSYVQLALTTALTLLAWPGYSQSGEVTVGDKTDIVSSVGGAALRLPDARSVSNGAGVLFTNLSANAVTLQTKLGGFVSTLAAGQARLVYLIDNATEAGVWRSLVFGVGTGSLDVSGIAGGGLTADVEAGKLSVELPLSELTSSFTFDETMRGRTVVWTAGAGVATIDGAAVNGGFVVAVRNQGTGTLLLQPISGTIDDAASVGLQPQESCYLVVSGSECYTIGRGRNQQFNFTLLIKSVTGGTVALTPTEASNVVQRYIGALVSNCIVQLPSVVQVYYVTNQTTGAFTLTFATAGVGSVVEVLAGQAAVLFCDGTNVINNSTSLSGVSVLSLAPGSIAAPSITYSGSPTTGYYRPLANSLASVANNSEILRQTGVSLAVNSVVLTNAVAGAAPTFAPQGSDADIDLNLTGKGTGGVRVTGSLNVTVALRGCFGPGGVVTNFVAGDGAFGGNLTGARNVAIGKDALITSTVANDVVAIGSRALRLATGSSHVAIGSAALTNMAGGPPSVAVGFEAMRNATSGGNSVAVGNNALRGNSTGIENVAVGSSAGVFSSTASRATLVGYEAGAQLSSGDRNTGIGFRALATCGAGAGNTALGAEAASGATGDDTTAIGRGSLTALVSSPQNTAVGSFALLSTTGRSNTAIGANAGSANTTGSGNVAIGGLTAAGANSPVFTLGAFDNRVVMGSSAVTNAYIQVAWTIVSDARDKTAIEPLAVGLDFVRRLRPVSYYNTEDRQSQAAVGPRRYGFLAQEVLAEEGATPVIIDTEDPEKLRMTDAHMVAVLTKALQELADKFDAYVTSHP